MGVCLFLYIETVFFTNTNILIEFIHKSDRKCSKRGMATFQILYIVILSRCHLSMGIISPVTLFWNGQSYKRQHILPVVIPFPIQSFGFLGVNWNLILVAGATLTP